MRVRSRGCRNRLGGGVAPAILPIDITRFSRNLKMPYNFQASIGVERQLGKKLTTAATWTNIRGVDLFRSRDLNAPLPPFYATTPYPQIGLLNQIESSGGLKNHSLQTTLRGNMSRFFTGLGTYEGSRSCNKTDGIAFYPAHNGTTRGEWERALF